MVVFGGLDLSATPSRPSGLAIINEDKELLFLGLVFEDFYIISKLSTFKPILVAVDAPLTYTGKPFRNVDKALMRAGFRILPSTWKGMNKLVERALAIKNSMNTVKFIETHPTSALKSSKCENHNVLFRSFGLKNLPDGIKEKHLIDALIASLVSFFSHLMLSRVFKEDDGEVHLLPILC